jgi:formylglycine-generating enzyme required for sulfatase activity
MRNTKILGAFLALTATISLVSANEPIQANISVKASAVVKAPNATTQSTTPKTALEWADVLEQSPNPKVVTDADFLARITATGLPWRVKDKGTGIEMLLVPPGKFIMGLSPGDTEAGDFEKPAHEVTLTKPFYLGRTEVTQAQWVKVAGNNPSYFHSASDRDSMIKKLMNEGLTKSEAEAKAAKESTHIDPLPVETVSWNDCRQFCAKTNLRLPTEAEWEYACRAGVRKPTYGALDDIAWLDTNSSGTTHIVGKKLPNALGFYDMLGNVCEWCSDVYDKGYYKSCEDGVVDPKGAWEGSGLMLRGGCWENSSIYCRSSHRIYIEYPDGRGRIIGFRVARTP